MAVYQFIRERGFRRWYERELARGHSHLLLLVMCALALMGAMEAFSSRGGGARLLMAGCIVVACALGAWALRRYLFHIMRAELLANQAVCGQCAAYARWDTDSFAADDAGPDAGTGSRMAVHCRSCGHPWTIDW